MFNFSYRARLALALAFALSGAPVMAQQADPLPSWNDGPAKQAILDLVRATTEPGSPDFVPPEERLATFDQDGTLWVEHPIYSQVVFALDRVVALAPEHPEWKDKEPFKTVLSGDRAAMAKLSLRDLEEIVFATHAGMTRRGVQRHRRGRGPPRPRTIAGTGPTPSWSTSRCRRCWACCAPTATAPTSSPAAARTSCAPTPSASTASARPRSSARRWTTKYGYDAKGQGVLMREPKLELNNNNSGKPEDIYLFTGQRPQAAFGNSTGDRQMLEWATAGAGKRLGMLVLHDDAEREYAYGPAAGLPDTKVGTFTQELLDEAKQARLDGDQHEERLEDGVPGGGGIGSRPSWRPSRCC